MMASRTIKLVIIGESGVGKTSIRGQYISGQFSTGYKATIGTDFISKSVPHYKNPDESVTLQIWDTAGQERFSSLASAFFRGADAVILMFDVNKPETLAGLAKWWNSFKERAPVPDEEAEDYCCVLVGNKIDLAEPNGNGDGGGNKGRKETVSETQAARFMEELIPQKTANAVSPDDGPDSDGENTTADEDERQNGHAGSGPLAADGRLASDDRLSKHSPPKSDSIQIRRTDSSSSHPYAKKPRRPGHRRGESSQSRKRVESASRSDDRVSHAGGGGGGTMTTTHTIYHTPASSLFGSESFASAQSSPFASASSVNTVHLSPDSAAAAASPPFTSTSTLNAPPAPAGLVHGRRLTSASSSSSSSAPTITPSLYQRAHSSTSAAVIQPSPLGTPSTASTALPAVSDSEPDLPTLSASATAMLEANGNSKDLRHRLPPYPDRRPKLFFTSAKTGAGVAPVFEYVAQRVVMKWEYEEALEERRMHVREATETIRLADSKRGTMGKLKERLSCCGS